MNTILMLSAMREIYYAVIVSVLGYIPYVCVMDQAEEHRRIRFAECVAIRFGENRNKDADETTARTCMASNNRLDCIWICHLGRENNGVD